MLAAYIQSVWATLLELAPWLFLGAAAAGALHVLLPADFVRRHLQGRGGAAKAVFLGVPLPLCSCGVIPVGLGMKKDGASDGAVVGFLIATPQTGVDSVLVTASFLGWPFAMFKVLAALTTGIIGGWIANGRQPPPTARDAGPGSTPAAPLMPIVDAPPSPWRRSWRAFWDHAMMILESVWRWLAFGVLVSAAIAVLVPEGSLAGLGRYGGVLAMLAALAVSLPMYVCATASVPIATALVAGGLPTGAALVFLMAGPATNVATIGAVGKTLGRRALAVYLTVIIAGSIAFGLTFEWLLAGAGTHAGHHHHGDSWWATVAAVALAALFGRFAWKDARRLAAARGLSRPLDAGAPTMQIDVAGMHCNSCVDRVASALAAEPGVEHVRVTLQPQQATVQGTISRERAAEIIAATGFETR